MKIKKKYIYLFFYFFFFLGGGSGRGVGMGGQGECEFLGKFTKKIGWGGVGLVGVVRLDVNAMLGGRG